MTQLWPAAVLWDFDGTLVDTEEHWEDVERGLARELGGELAPDYHQHSIGGPISAMATLIRDASGTDRPVAELEDELWARASARLQGGPIPWMPGVAGLVDALRAAGVPQGLVSSGHRVYLDVLLGRLDPQPFGVVVAGDEVTHNKPHPDGYLRAAQALGVRVQDCLVIEDSRTGVAAGLAAGSVVLAVPTVHVFADAAGLVVVPTLAGLGVEGVREAYAKGLRR